MSHVLTVAMLFVVMNMASLAQLSPQGYPPASPNPNSADVSSESSSVGQGTAWMPVGLGIELYGRRSTVMNGDLYILAVGTKGRIYTGQIYRLENNSWTLLNEFTIDALVYAFGSYKGDLYVGGYFSNLNGLTDTKGIARWDGTSWHSVGGADGSPYAMIEYQGELYVGGSFNAIGGKPIKGLARWDGTRWASVSADALLPDSSTYQVSVNDFAIDGNELFVGGIFAGVDGVKSSNIISWNGIRWQGLGEGLDRDPQILKFYHGELYVAGHYIRRAGTTTLHHLARWNGARWDSVGSHGNWVDIRDVEVHNDHLYVVGMSEIRIGMRWDGASWTPLQPLNDGTEFAVSYGGSLYIGGWFDKSGLTSLNHVARLCDEGACGQITGTVFRDDDLDCAFDSTESGLMRRIVEITPGPYLIMTDSAGRFAQWVPPGDYRVGVTSRPYWNQTCPVSPTTISTTIAQAGDIDSASLFAMQPVADVNDLRISIASGRMRPGFTVPFTIVYENVGTTMLSGTVHLQHDTRLTLQNSTPPVAQTVAGWIEWNFTDLDPDEMGRIDLQMVLSDSTAIGTNLTTIAVVTPIEDDSTRDDNSDTLHQEVRGSYDPNDITVTPVSNNEVGWLTQADSVLTYTIRFQNTGTDTAFTVVVRDTLALTHDPSTIRLGATSHPATFSMMNNGTLVWRFDNILLPDSGTNESASHGYIKYSVHIRRNLPNGTVIPNRADIYFDFNRPVSTNTVQSILMETASVSSSLAADEQMAIYPNPSQGVIHVEGDVASGSVIEVKDVVGRVMLLHTVTANPGGRTIDLSNLASGTYFLGIPTDSGRVLRKVSIVR